MLFLAVFIMLAVSAPTGRSGVPDSDAIFHRTVGGVCEVGHFRCNSSDICVAQRKICDQESDCPDESDEWNCDDHFANQFYDHIFRKRPGAESDGYQKCRWNNTGKCVCNGADVICLHLGLTRIPAGFPISGIELLDLTGNNFQYLTAATLEPVTEALTLVLSYCSIREIAAEVFYNISSLQNLYMDHNEIQTLPENMFPKYNRIKNLVLSANGLRNLSDGVFAELGRLVELDLRNNKLERINRAVLRPLKRLEILYLNGNRLRWLGPHTFPQLPILVLSLSDNRLTGIESGTFSNFSSLKNLYISGNRLTSIKNGTFTNLNDLLALNLNENSLNNFETGAFQPLVNLTSLYLKGNKFKMLDKRVLQNLANLQYVYFDEFSMCRAARHVRVCEPKGDGISSQFHLLDNPVLRASVWLMGVVAVVGNALVLLGRLLAREPNAVHSLYIRNLALSDLLMGVYLFVIAAADERYRGFYIDHEHTWRHSPACNFCGFLSTLSCESSALILALVTWDRLASVARPLQRLKPASRAAAALRLATLWGVSVLLALAPLSPLAPTYFGDEFYAGNGVCLSLHIHDPYAKGWEYSAAMFVLVNALALSFIVYAHARMLREIRASGLALRSTQESQERAVAKRFGIIVLTDCMCWVPVIGVKLAALSGIQISEALYAWLAVLVLPINSALNPVLYTLTTTHFKQQIRNVFVSCTENNMTEIHANSADESGQSISLWNVPPGSRRRLLVHRTLTGTQTTSVHSSVRSVKR